MKLRLVVCAVIFAAGVLVGRLSLGTRTEPGVTVVDTVSSADYAIAVPAVETLSDAVMDRAGDRAEKLSGELPNPEADSEAKGSGENLELVRRMSELQKSGALSFSVPAFDQDKHIRKEVKQLLEITDDEEAALNKLMDETLSKVRELEWASASSKTEGGKVIITLPPYAEAGGKVYDSALSRMESIVGAERSEMLQQIGSFESQFNGFGTNEREITLSIYTGNAKPMILVADKSQKRRLIEGGHIVFDGSSSSTSILDRAMIIRKFGPQAEKWVPAELPK